MNVKPMIFEDIDGLEWDFEAGDENSWIYDILVGKSSHFHENHGFSRFRGVGIESKRLQRHVGTAGLCLFMMFPSHKKYSDKNIF